MRVFVGVSGFSYTGWKGKFYPDDAKAEDFLNLYARRLHSVEINSSFYATPSTAMVKSWSAKTNEEFRFAFKAPRQITHIQKLREESYPGAIRMSDTLDNLGPRRGPILFQLPPYTKFDRELLDGFLSHTSAIEPKVFEFRHQSWLNDRAYSVLEDHGAGFCIADTEDMEPTFKVTGGLAYFRLRKDSYDGSAIDRWSEKILETAKGSEECYVYLRHDEAGENAILAERLAKTLKSE